MRRFALLLGFVLSLISTSAVAQNCDGFTDVLASSPFCPDVTWMKTFGITKGCTATTYCPNDSVTRLQMAAFMHRLGENPAFVNGGNAFGVTPRLSATETKTLAELSEKFDVHSSQIVQWKAQLLDGAMGVFLTPAEKRGSQGPSVKDMQAKIGQLALENDFLASALGRIDGASAKK